MLYAIVLIIGASLTSAQTSFDFFLSHGIVLADLPELGQLLTNPGPFLALSWSASVAQFTGVSSLGISRGMFFYDAQRQRWRMKTCSTQKLFRPNDEMCMDQLAKNISDATGFNLNMTIGKGSNAVCKAYPNPYYDILFLSLMYSATHEGSKTVDGEACEIWRTSFTSPEYAMNISSCIASDGVPREHNFTSNIAYKAASSSFFRFSNVSIGRVSDDDFLPSEVCEHRYPMPACPSGTVMNFDVYRVRSLKEPNVLSNRDVGDALGDMAFFCGVGGMDETQAVTHWAVQANSSWGQYAYCLYLGGKNVCFGSSGKNVGRESAEGLGHGAVQGQCTANADVGSWLSFPAEGLCAEGAPIGHDDCTWMARPLRTVSAACILNERGLKESCAEERGHAPMTRSVAIFKAALETANPTQGGCPDVTDGTDQASLLV